VCLESIIANDYPKDKLEVLVADGMSEDETRGVVDSYGEYFTGIQRCAWFYDKSHACDVQMHA
jgi:cellulose synthase/poly-beta-1,6-N-acetylglucosamine synthase-like glycosyltransferase